MVVCTDCGGTVIEYDAAAGNGFCVQCGTVLEENTIVNEVSFGETAAGAAMVQGSYVGQGATHARMGGPFGNRGNTESREQTIANANRKIQSIASVLRLSDVVSLAATRLYTLAVEHKFTKGRKSLNVVAVCLYVACRQKETRNYMLIDFSDLLQVNVFELGHTYLQLVQTLNLRLPLVDPSHYISRFAALLEFGDETHKVATDAIRLVQRFDRDWMTKGRRPAGICGACLLLAARMNNFRRSVEEIVQVVKIADTTLRKRLKEFKETPSGALTLTDFRTVWLEEEMDPPAFIKGKEKERATKGTEADEEASEETGRARKRTSKTGKRKRKRRNVNASDEEDGGGVPHDDVPRAYLDPMLLNSGILTGTCQPEPLFLPEPGEGILHNPTGTTHLMEQPTSDSLGPPPSQAIDPGGVTDTVSPLEVEVNNLLTEEVAEFLLNDQGAQLSAALNEVNERRMAAIQLVDELTGLDEEELDQFLLTEEEIQIKERVWVEMNREYLEAIAAKGEQHEPGTASTKHKKRRKHATKPRDASTPHGNTAAESVRTLLKQNARYSKRINYDALKDLFTDEKDEDNDGKLYTIHDDKDEEIAPSVVVEEGGGRVGGHADLINAAELQRDPEYMDDGDGSDKGNDYGDIGWEDTYEQEV